MQHNNFCVVLWILIILDQPEIHLEASEQASERTNERAYVWTTELNCDGKNIDLMLSCWKHSNPNEKSVPDDVVSIWNDLTNKTCVKWLNESYFAIERIWINELRHRVVCVDMSKMDKECADSDWFICTLNEYLLCCGEKKKNKKY